MLELEECWRWVADELHYIIVTVSQNRIRIITLHTELVTPATYGQADGQTWSVIFSSHRLRVSRDRDTGPCGYLNGRTETAAAVDHSNHISIQYSLSD